MPSIIISKKQTNDNYFSSKSNQVATQTSNPSSLCSFKIWSVYIRFETDIDYLKHDTWYEIISVDIALTWKKIGQW